LARTSFQEKIVSSPSYSFAVDDLVAEKGDEASSSQALSEENQAKLKEILSLLQTLELIDQDLPYYIKASLEPISQLDIHFAAVKWALKNQCSQPAMEQRRATAKQSVKNLHAQIQNNKELLANLQPALELKKTRKAVLEAELRTLTAEIEADEKKMAELHESTEKIRKEALAALNAGRQLKINLSALSKTQEADQKLLENINKIISDATIVISKYLGV
jgi:DNA repair exonuclease SbcCD ATPase subunit